MKFLLLPSSFLSKIIIIVVADEQRYYRNFMVPFIDVITCLMKISSNC